MGSEAIKCYIFTILHTQLNYLTKPVTPFNISFVGGWGGILILGKKLNHKQVVKELLRNWDELLTI